MMIFWDAGLVLLAVPKTGTQALQEAMGAEADIVIRNPPAQKHMPLRGYRKAIEPLFGPVESRRLETVAVIREPLDWLGSWYRYRRRKSRVGHVNSTRELSFAEFVTAYLQADPPAYADVGRQSRFVGTPDGERGVDHLFSYERYSEFVGFLEWRLGHPIRLHRTNVSPRGNLALPQALADEARDRLGEEFALHALADEASRTRARPPQRP